MVIIKRNSERNLLVQCVILLGVIVLSGCDALNELDNADDGTPLGEWQIIHFSGSIKLASKGDGTALCEAFEEEFFPVLDEDLDYIKFIEVRKEPDFQHIPSSVYDAYQFDSDGLVFIFHITFDNGYYSNQVLEGLGVQIQYESFLADAWSMAGGVYSESEMVSAEIQGFTESGTSDGGHNKFIMKGNFISDTRIEGTWEWEEYNTFVGLPECNSSGSGSGSWVAEKK